MAILWAILPHPSLYLTGLGLLPSKRYIGFRLHTQYGDKLPEIRVLKDDLINYISWVKNYSNNDRY